MDDTVQYIAQDGDRWDMVAYRMYGTVGDIMLADGTTVSSISYIINANPDVPITDFIAGGTALQIPILNSTDVAIDNSLLPPWKQV